MVRVCPLWCFDLNADLSRDRSDSGKLELDRVAAAEEARFSALSTTDKALDWASRHQYSIILGSWAVSMAAAGAIVAKDK